MVTTILYTNEKLNWETGTFDTSYLSNNCCRFELIEEQQGIDIQAMNELNENWRFANWSDEAQYFRKITNELIQALKQLDNKINKE